MSSHSSPQWTCGKDTQHVVEMGLTLLAQASLPFQHLDHAFLTNVYLTNRCHPTPALHFEVLYMKLLGLLHIPQRVQMFGS